MPDQKLSDLTPVSSVAADDFFPMVQNSDPSIAKSATLTVINASATLAGLGDTNISSPADGDLLRYDSATGKWVKVTPTLAGQSDVDLTSPADGDLLRYDSASGKWVEVTPTLNMQSDVDISSPADGEMLAYNATSGKWENVTAPSGGSGFDNGLLNGDGAIAQRTAPATWTSIFERVSGAWPTVRKFGPDRWAVQANESTTDGHKIEYRRYDKDLSADTDAEKTMAFRRSAVGKIAAYQLISALNAWQYRGKKVVLQALLRSGGNAQTVRLGLAEWTSTADTIPAKAIAASATWTTDPALATNFAWISNSSDISVGTGSWTLVSLLVDLTSYTSFNNLGFFIYNSADTTAANDVLYMRNAALTIGESVPAYVTRHYELEVALCQKYFWKNYNLNTAPGTTGSATPGYIILTDSIPDSGYFLSLPIGQHMRIAPSGKVNTYSYNGVSGRCSNGSGTDYDANSAVSPATSKEGLQLFYNNSGSALTISANRFLFVGITADSEL